MISVILAEMDNEGWIKKNYERYGFSCFILDAHMAMNNKCIVATANQLKFWFVADTKETNLTADKHINRCEASENVLSKSTATHPGEGKGFWNNCT